jgi:CheY-like chemotaxis protein
MAASATLPSARRPSVVAHEATERAHAVTRWTLEAGALTRCTRESCGSILVVDDDEMIQSATSALLTGEGYVVTVAANGREALDHLRHGSTPRVIVLDFEMPVMNGFEFRAEQRRDPVIARIPVIVCSGARRPGHASALGLHEWLPKPVDPGRLLATLDRYVRPSSLRMCRKFSGEGGIRTLGRGTTPTHA